MKRIKSFDGIIEEDIGDVAVDVDEYVEDVNPSVFHESQFFYKPAHNDDSFFCHAVEESVEKSISKDYKPIELQTM